MRIRNLLASFILIATAWSVSPLIAQEITTPKKAKARTILAEVKTDHPRDTMRTYLAAMNDYKRGVEQDNPRLKARINDAIRTFDLSGVNELLREQAGFDTAVQLKEVMDRVILIKLKYIPTLDTPEGKADLAAKGHRWRLKDTEITISRIESGPRKGEYLFTKDTVAKVRSWFERVKHLPYVDGLQDFQKGSGYKPPWIQTVVPKWMNDKLWGMAFWQWIGLGVAILFGLAMKVVVRHLVTLLGRLVAKSESDWDDKVVDALKGPVGYLAAVGLWFASVYLLRFEGLVLNAFMIFLKVYFSVVLIWLLYRLAGVLTEYLEQMAAKTESTLDDQLVPLLNRTIKIIIVISGVLIAIQNLGFNVMSVLAGLGIGGLAIAMAAKDTVANFFGSLMILFDRPFQVGDWILVSGAEGTVEEIGFRSTRIRTFYNSVISVPNSDVANSTIDNMGMRQYRRAKTTLGVTYDTPPEKLEAFMEGCKNIIKANPYTRKDYFHVVFTNYGPSSLDILLYFFFKVPTWNDELVERQNIYLEIYRLAHDLGVSFAYPTQTLHIENFPEKKSLSATHEINVEKLKSSAKSFGKGGANAKTSGHGIFLPPHRESTSRGADRGEGE